MKKTYWVMWTYIANFSALTEVQAESPEEAAKQFADYGPEFAEKANVFVWDRKPLIVQHGEKAGRAIYQQ